MLLDQGKAHHNIFFLVKGLLHIVICEIALSFGLRHNND